MKRAYYHGKLHTFTEANEEKIFYENHLVFEDINPGVVFGARSLLDHMTFNK